MIEEQAIVIKASKEHVTLEVVRSKPCGLCGQVRGCGNSIWGKIFSHQSGLIETRNNLNAKLGDVVILGIDETLMLKGSLMLYGVPLLLMFLGMAIANSFVTHMIEKELEKITADHVAKIDELLKHKEAELLEV